MYVVGWVHLGKYRQNLHLKVSSACAASVQESRDRLLVPILVHYLLLTLLYVHMLLMAHKPKNKDAMLVTQIRRNMYKVGIMNRESFINTDNCWESVDTG